MPWITDEEYRKLMQLQSASGGRQSSISGGVDGSSGGSGAAGMAAGDEMSGGMSMAGTAIKNVSGVVSDVFNEVATAKDQDRADKSAIFNERMANRRQALEEQTGLAGMKNARRGLGMQGMELLANQRTEAGKAARQRRFNTDLYAAMRGV